MDLQDFYKCDSYDRHIQRSYDHLTESVLKSAFNITVKSKGFTVIFSNLHIIGPDITPKQCINNNKSYSITTKINVCIKNEQDLVVKQKDVDFLQVPLVVGSRYCNEKFDTCNINGVFIINGIRKVLIPSQTIGYNQWLVNDKHSIQIRNTCKLNYFTSLTKITIDNGLLFITPPILKKCFPLYIFAKIYKCTISEIEELNDNVLLSQFLEINDFTDEQLVTKLKSYDKCSSIHNLPNELFSNVHFDKKKFVLLSGIKILLSKKNAIFKNENNLFNIRFEDCSKLIEILLMNVKFSLQKKLLHIIDKNMDIMTNIIRMGPIFTKDILYAFSTGTWTNNSRYSKYNKSGVSQIVQSFNSYTMKAHLSNVTLNVSKDIKNYRIRGIHKSHENFLCIVTTSENISVGLIKSLCKFVLITTDTDEDVFLIKKIFTGQKIFKGATQKKIAIIYNGEHICFVNESSVKVCLEKFRTMRRHHQFDMFTTIGYNKDLSTVYIFSDGGRLVRPVFWNNEKVVYIDSNENACFFLKIVAILTKTPSCRDLQIQFLLQILTQVRGLRTIRQ